MTAPLITDTPYSTTRLSRYLDFLEATVLPQIRTTFNLDASDHSVSIMGSSLGGLLACYAGWTRPATFSSSVCMSSSFWWSDEAFLHSVLNATGQAGQTRVGQGLGTASTTNTTGLFYLDSGTAGPGNDDENETIAVRDRMTALARSPRPPYYYLDPGGTHNEHYWGARFWRPLTDLFPAAGAGARAEGGSDGVGAGACMCSNLTTCCTLWSGAPDTDFSCHAGPRCNAAVCQCTPRLEAAATPPSLFVS